MNMFVSSENSAVAITLNSEKETLVPVGSFFDKIHCMCWTAHFSSFWKEYSEKSSFFDMFEDTCVTRREWQEIMHLNIPEIVPSEFVNEAMETLSAIDRWVTEEIGENEEFIVIGV